MDDFEHEWRERLRTRELWHVTPLHYVPAILAAGALHPKAVLAEMGIALRETAKRRDSMLGLSDYVHFSFAASTPLLRDKLSLGYAHAVFGFSGGALTALPHALLPYNTKAWRSKSCYEPVTDAWDKARLLRGYGERGRTPSLEFLVRGSVPLSAVARIVFVTDVERGQIAHLAESLGLRLPAPLMTDGLLAPQDYDSVNRDAIASYFADCRLARRVLPPPEIAFD